ncbi:MAG: hypothetical protein H6737_23335 [Alphaproteobacteria bacterium]|nr:hypothetical protein [Alphaproteobacteria bacterium]
MLVALLVGCSPWPGVAAGEAVWWGPTDRIEAEQHIDLVDLPAGEPIGYWPRVEVYADRIAIDSRATVLSLPPEVRDGIPPELLDRLLIESRTVASVTAGRVPKDAKRGQLITGLYDALLALAEAHKDLALATRDESLEFRGLLTVVPDAATSAELLREVIFTAGQAQFGSAALAGASGGRLRMATAFDGASCAIPVLLEGSPGGAGIDASGVGLRGASCTAPPDEVPRVLQELAAACDSRLDRIAATVAERHPGLEPVDPAEWRCIVVHPSVSEESDATVADLLPALASVLPSHPAIRHGYVLSRSYGPDACEARRPIAELTDDELDRVCNVEYGLASVEAATEAVAAGHGLFRWRQRLRIRERAQPFEPSAVLEALDVPREAWRLVEHSITGPDGPDPDAENTLRRYAGQLKYCIERDGTDLPKGARVTFRGPIELAGGRIVSHGVRFPDDPDVEACVSGRLARWKFVQELSGSREMVATFAWSD